MRKWSLKSPEQLRSWGQLQKKVMAAKEADEQAEEDLGEIPDEFLGLFPFLSISRITMTDKVFRSSYVYSYGGSCHSSRISDLS